MAKRFRKTADKEENSEKRNKFKDEHENTRKSEDYCFICKDGGKLHLCDHEECVKAYHSSCLKERKLSMPSSTLPWHCGRHRCSKCHDPSTLFCYCCPTALCHDCVDAIHFLPIKNQHGFCDECRGLALFIENEVEVENLSDRNRIFKEYYEIVKKDEGLSLKDLQSPQERLQMKHEVLFASIVPDNMKLVYLKKNLVQKLLEEPESFKSKVEGSYVRIESAPSNGHQRKFYQLIQVTGVKMGSSDQDTDIKLQLLGIPNDICINSISDVNFSEAECEDLRQKMNAGLLKKPTVDEFEEKAKSLHKDITDHELLIEKKLVQNKIDHANEKGWRSTLYELLKERTRLEKPSYLLQLLSIHPKVVPELPEPSNELKEASEIKSITKDTNEQMQTKDVGNERDGNRIASDTSKSKSISKDIEEERKTNSSLRFIPIHIESGGLKTTSEKSSSIPGKENPKKLTSAALLCYEVDLDELLDQLIKPDESRSSPDDDTFEALQHFEKGLILSMKKFSVSEFKRMIQVANVGFTCLKGLRINYTSLYERVKNYIRCSALLSSTDQFKQGSSMEELAAQFNLQKEYNEMVHTEMKKLSSYMSEAFRVLGDKISNEEKSFRKFETERCVSRTEHHSRTLREVSEKLEKARDTLKFDLQPPLRSKKQCQFEAVVEAFLKAKTALGL